jgi:hypothetical protein
MKVTALIPDDLLEEIKTLAQGKNLTESLITALSEWAAMRKVKQLNTRVKKKPLKFSADFSPETLRDVNRS